MSLLLYKSPFRRYHTFASTKREKVFGFCFILYNCGVFVSYAVPCCECHAFSLHRALFQFAVSMFCRAMVKKITVYGSIAICDLSKHNRKTRVNNIFLLLFSIYLLLLLVSLRLFPLKAFPALVSIFSSLFLSFSSLSYLPG